MAAITTDRWSEFAGREAVSLATADPAATHAFIALIGRKQSDCGTLLRAVAAAAWAAIAEGDARATLCSSAAAALGAFVPPLNGPALARIMRSAITRACLGCDDFTTDLSETGLAAATAPVDVTDVLLCPLCTHSHIRPMATVPDLLRPFVPWLAAGATGVAVLAEHATAAERAGPPLATAPAVAPSPPAEGVVTTGERLAASTSVDRALQAATAGGLEPEEIRSLDDMCRVLGDGYKMYVEKLLAKHAAAEDIETRNLVAPACKKRAGVARGSTVYTVVSRVKRLSMSSAAIRARLARTAVRWNAVCRLIETGGLTVAAFMALRPWFFSTQMRSKKLATDMWHWLAVEDGSGCPGGPDAATEDTPPTALVEAVEHMRVIGGHIAQLETAD
ncbi:MAG: hypothetical protein M0R22_12625, partial [Dehalococcoidia bacterium]|nr:hypothetical protein [Dehalococcoidia bacterium]